MSGVRERAERIRFLREIGKSPVWGTNRCLFPSSVGGLGQFHSDCRSGVTERGRQQLNACAKQDNTTSKQLNASSKRLNTFSKQLNRVSKQPNAYAKQLNSLSQQPNA